MEVVRLWQYRVPNECLVDLIEHRGEWLNLGLYCSDDYRRISIDIASGRAVMRGGGELELRGVVEFKREFYVLRCFHGFGNRVWSLTKKALAAKMMCRKETCVVALLKPNYNLEVNIINRMGTILDTITLGNTIDFDIGATQNTIFLSTISPYTENSTVLLVDAASNTVIDEITGFGGHILSSPSLVIINGEHENRFYAKIYSDEGEEIVFDEGVGILLPYNPYPYQIPGIDLYHEKTVIVMDQFSIKVYSIADLNLEYTLLKPPHTRAVFDVDPEANTVTALARVSGLPIVVNFGFKGEVRWQSHIVRGLSRVLHSNTIATLFDEYYKRETRINLIKPPVLEEITRFSPGTEPLVVWGKSFILFDGEFIRAYTAET